MRMVLVAPGVAVAEGIARGLGLIGPKVYKHTRTRAQRRAVKRARRARRKGVDMN